jgi:hypothetical protein
LAKELAAIGSQLKEGFEVAWDSDEAWAMTSRVSTLMILALIE